METIATPIQRFLVHTDHMNAGNKHDIMKGDTIEAQVITPEEIVLGKICIFKIEENYLIRRITSINGNTLTLHADNPDYADFEVQKEDIETLYLATSLLPAPVNYELYNTNKST